MLKKLNSFTNTQLVIFILYLVALTYLFSYLVVKYVDSIECNLNSTFEISNLMCASVGLFFALSATLITLYLACKNNKCKSTKKEIKKPTKKK